MKSDTRPATSNVSSRPVSEDLGFLSRLRFVTRLRRRGGTWGERRSTRRGAGLEFADYRDYTPGDDLRRVDWNLYARLDRPYIRLYEEEEDLAVAVLLDGSASMGWEGDEAHPRWPVARRLASALGTMALLGGDQMRGALLQRGRVEDAWGPLRGRGYIARWTAWVTSLTPVGEGGLGSALDAYAGRALRPGLVLLLTDGYDVNGLTEGITALAGRGHEVIVLHLLTPEELAPSLHGDLRLVDVEDGRKREVTLDALALTSYRHRLRAWQADLRVLVGGRNGRYVMLRTDMPLRKMFLEDLRHAHVIR